MNQVVPHPAARWEMMVYSVVSKKVHPSVYRKPAPWAVVRTEDSSEPYASSVVGLRTRTTVAPSPHCGSSLQP